MSKENTITGVLVDKETNKITIVNVKDELEEYYKLLKCSLIDCPVRKFGEHWLNVVCDEEGLLKEGNKPSIYTYHNNKVVEVIVGNCLIVANDGSGNFISLTEDEIKAVMDNRYFNIIEEKQENNSIYKCNNILIAEV